MARPIRPHQLTAPDAIDQANRALDAALGRLDYLDIIYLDEFTEASEAKRRLLTETIDLVARVAAELGPVQIDLEVE
jgi:hypothetical protein